jgi:exopolysaccharide biosynthesis WecB/TagA/CpsF family protein
MRFDRLGCAGAIDVVSRLAGQAKFSYVVTPNVDHIVQLHKDEEETLAEAYSSADLSLCDSRIVYVLARLANIDLQIVTGSDLTRNLLMQKRDFDSIAIIGGNARLHQDMASFFPWYDWHFFEPPMGVRHDPAARSEIADFIERVGADVIFFAIGAPQSEITCAEIKRRGKARGVALCTGASLFFLTGDKRRAPRWMQAAGIEWLFRLLSEPSRLWRRYLLDGPRVIGIWLSWRRARASHPSCGSDSTNSGDV